MAYDALLRLPTKRPPNGSSGGGLPSPPTAGNLIVGQGASWASKTMSGDATMAASGALTLANTAVTPGTYGDATHVGQFTVDAKGRLTFAQNVAITTSSGTVTSISQGTGITATPNPITSTGTIALANTAVTPGTYGDSTHVGQFTVDQQGRLTFAQNVALASSSGPLLDSTHNTDTVTHTPVLGDMIYANATPAWQALAGSTSAAKKFLTQTGTGAVSAAPSWGDVTAADVTSGQALSRVNDTNVTLTLGGSPTTALLAATSLTLGWTGTLAVSRGGTGAGTFTAHGVLIGEGTSAISATAAGTSGQLLIGQGATSDPTFNTMSGDATIANTGALTLATVNANVGSFGNATSVATFTVNAKGLITAASNVAIGGLAAVDGVHNIGWRQQQVPSASGAAVFTAIGLGGTLNTNGTTSMSVDTDFHYINYATSTAANTEAGLDVNTADDVRLSWLPDVTIQFKTGAAGTDVAGIRIFVGLASVTNLNADTGANNMIAFRFSTAAGDTNWMAFTRDNAGGSTATSTGVAVTANTAYKFRIVATSTTTVDFYINDVLTNSGVAANLPSLTVSMNMVAQAYNVTAGTARNIKIHRFYMTSI